MAEASAVQARTCLPLQHLLDHLSGLCNLWNSINKLRSTGRLKEKLDMHINTQNIHKFTRWDAALLLFQNTFQPLLTSFHETY